MAPESFLIQSPNLYFWVLLEARRLMEFRRGRVNPSQ